MYHYTSRDTALEHILSTRKIRLGPLSKTNDPRGTKSWTFGIPGDGDFPASLEERKAEIDRVVRISAAAEKIRANCKVLCTTMDDPTYNSTLYPMIDFKRGFGHSRMWAQYGEAHKGVCLIFDRAELHQAIENLTAGCNLYYGPVEYTEKISGSEITSTALDQREMLSMVSSSFSICIGTVITARSFSPNLRTGRRSSNIAGLSLVIMTNLCSCPSTSPLQEPL